MATFVIKYTFYNHKTLSSLSTLGKINIIVYYLLIMVMANKNAIVTVICFRLIRQ